MPPLVDLTVDWHLEEVLIEDDELESLLVHALDQEGQTGSWEIAIRFVDDAEMTIAHDAWLGDPSPTDIMTFPYDEEDGTQGGDILISIDTANANAADHGWLTAEELRFLALHGLLHILGWDDHDPAARSRMLDRQHELLAGWREQADR